MFASAYIAIDVSERWPTDADLREIAEHASQSVIHLDAAALWTKTHAHSRLWLDMIYLSWPETALEARRMLC